MDGLLIAGSSKENFDNILIHDHDNERIEMNNRLQGGK